MAKQEWELDPIVEDWEKDPIVSEATAVEALAPRPAATAVAESPAATAIAESPAEEEQLTREALRPKSPLREPYAGVSPELLETWTGKREPPTEEERLKTARRTSAKDVIGMMREQQVARERARAQEPFKPKAKSITETGILEDIGAGLATGLLGSLRATGKFARAESDFVTRNILNLTDTLTGRDETKEPSRWEEYQDKVRRMGIKTVSDWMVGTSEEIMQHPGLRREIPKGYYKSVKGLLQAAPYMGGQTAGYMLPGVVTGALGGPGAAVAFSTGFARGFEEIHDRAIANGMGEDAAFLASFSGGLIYGKIEQLQLRGLKWKSPAISEAVSRAAGNRIMSAVAKGTRPAKQLLKTAFREGMEEVSQGGTVVLFADVPMGKVDFGQISEEAIENFVGGFGMGLGFGGVGAVNVALQPKARATQPAPFRMQPKVGISPAEEWGEVQGPTTEGKAKYGLTIKPTSEERVMRERAVPPSVARGIEQARRGEFAPAPVSFPEKADFPVTEKPAKVEKPTPAVPAAKPTPPAERPVVFTPSGLSPEATYFNTPITAFEGYAWRLMGKAEYDRLMRGEKTYGGGKPAQKGNFLAPTPQSAAQYKTKGKILVEFGGVEKAEGETVSNLIDTKNITATKQWSGTAWEETAAKPAPPAAVPPAEKVAPEPTVGQPGEAIVKQAWEPIRVGRGQSGGKIISRSARTPGRIQVTRFTEEGIPAGHEEYNTLAEAIQDNWQELDNPISQLAQSSPNRLRAWEEATFEHPYADKLMDIPYHYVSPLRPLSGVQIEGEISTNKSGRVGVLYRKSPLSIDKLKSLSLIPSSSEAVAAFSKELADLAEGKPTPAPPAEAMTKMEAAQPAKGEWGAENKLVTREKYEQAKKKLGETELFTGLPVDKMKALVDIGAFHFEAGLRKFPTWAKQMRDEFGDKIKGQLRNIWNEMSPTRQRIQAGEMRVAEIERAEKKATHKAALPSEVKKRLRAEAKWPKGEPVAMTPAQLLRYAYKHEAKAARAGYGEGKKVGYLEGRARGEEIGQRIGTLRGGKQVVELHKDIAKWVTETLPKSEQSKIIPVLTKARTPASIRAVVRSVGKILDSYEHRGAMSDYKKARTRIKSAIRKGQLRPEYQEKANALLDSIRDTEPTGRTLVKMNRLMKMLEVEEDPNIPDTVIRRAKTILAKQKATPLQKLSPDAIRGVAAALERIVFLNDKKNMMYFGRQKRTADQQIADSVEEVKSRHAIKHEVGEEEPRQAGWRWVLSSGQVSVDSRATQMGGEGSTVQDILVNRPLEGNKQFLRIQQEAQDILRSKLEKMGITPKKLNKLREDTTTTELPKAIQGEDRIKTVELTTAQRIDLINHLRDGSTRHEIIKHASKGIKVRRRLGKPIKLYAEDIAALEDSFTVQEKEIASIMSDWMNTSGKNYTNEAFLKTHGHEIAFRDDYWPRVRDAEARATEPDKIMQYWTERQLDEQGIFKPREGSVEPVIVEDAFTKFLTHVNRVAAMHGKHAPTLDALRLLRNPDFREAVKMRYRRGGRVLMDMEKAIKTYRGLEVKQDLVYEKMMRGMIRRSHIGVLGFKPHIAAYQTVSYLNALAEMDARDVAKFWNWRLPVGELEGEIKKLSPELRARFEATGHQILTPEMAPTSINAWYFAKETGLGHKAMAAIRTMDRVAIVNIYQISKAEGKRKGLSGDALLDYAAKRAEFVTRRTQPTWDPLTTSGLVVESRSSVMAKLATMFSSQRTKNANIVFRAVTDFNHSKKAAGDYAKLLKRVGVVAAQAAIIYAIGDKSWSLYFGDDESDEKEFSDHVVGVVERILGNWVAAGDILSEAIQMGYDVLKDKPLIFVEPRNNILVGAFTDLMGAMTHFVKATQEIVEGERYEGGTKPGELKAKYTALRGVDRLMRGLAIVSGVPATMFWTAARKRVPTLKPPRQKTFYYNRLWRAIESGNDKAARRAMQQLKNLGVTRDKITSGAKSRKIPYDQRTKAENLYHQ